jgi:indole-3-glycerol phosphate synthase
MTVLDEILATKRDEVTMLHRPEVRDLLRARALDAPAARDFAGALRPASGALGVVAEIKRRSPSTGELAPELGSALTPKAYAA